MDKVLSALGQRVFVMNNVHDDRPVVFQTRWTLSYLRGPLTREQIHVADGDAQAGPGPAGPDPGGSSRSGGGRGAGGIVGIAGRGRIAPVVPPDVPVFFVPRRARLEPGESLLYRPAILGVARLHYADKKAAVDHWETLALLQPVGDEMPAEPWAEAVPFDDGVPELDKAPEAGARFAPMPSELARAKCYAEWTKSLKNYLYRERTLDLWSCPEVKAISRPAEAEREFRLRVAQASREERDREVEALRAKYAPKMSALQDQIRRARERLEREQAQATKSTWDATIAMGSSVLGALLGRKAISKTNVTRAASAARAAGRAAQQHGDVGQAGESLESLQRKYAALDAKFREEVSRLDAALRPRSWRWSACPSAPGRRTSPSSRSSWPGRRGRSGARPAGGGLSRLRGWLSAASKRRRPGGSHPGDGSRGHLMARRCSSCSSMFLMFRTKIHMAKVRSMMGNGLAWQGLAI